MPLRWGIFENNYRELPGPGIEKVLNIKGTVK